MSDQQEPQVDGAEFRRAMGRFPTGVTVMTGYTGDGTPVGVTVSAFTSLSLHPPMILFCLTVGTGSMEAFEPGKAFNVNILAVDQDKLSNQFAGPVEERFTGVAYEPGTLGAPVLPDTAATVECTVDQTFAGGDHYIIVGHVVHVTVADDKNPLVYCQSSYFELGESLAG